MPNGMLLFNIWDKIGNFLAGVFSIIPKLLYFIVSCILSLIDLCQVAFRKLAGLDPIMIPSSDQPFTGDSIYRIIVDALFNNAYPAVKTIFWALIILGIFMLLVTSIIAVIRLEYAPDKDKGNSKAGVIKNFFKAIFSFAIIPITCLFGMFVANSLVNIIDTATAYNTVSSTEISKYFDKWTGSDSKTESNDLLNYNDNSYYAYNVFGIRIPTTSEPFSATVFKACAYSCNRVRNNSNYFDDLKNAETLGIFQNFDAQEPAANIIDEGFAINARLKGKHNLDRDISKPYYQDWTLIKLGGWKLDGLTELSKYNVDAIFYFYDLWSFNYIVAFIALMSIGKSFYAFVLFLMQRMFEILGLFLVSPISVGLMPLDNGDSLKQWRSAFVTKFALLVIMVLSLNLVTPLISIGQNIKLFGNKLVDYIITTLFLVAALNAVSSLNSMFSKIFTGDDKNWGQIDNAAKGIQGSFAQGLGKTMAAARIAAAPFTLTARAAGTAISARNNRRIRNRVGRNYDAQLHNRENAFNAQMAQLQANQQSNQQRLDNLNADAQLYNDYNQQRGTWHTNRLHTASGRQDMVNYLQSRGYSAQDAQATAQRLSARAQQVRAANLNGNGNMNGNMYSLMQQSYDTERNNITTQQAAIMNQMQTAQSTMEADRARHRTEREQAINDAINNRWGNRVAARVARAGAATSRVLRPYGSSFMAISGFDPYRAPQDQALSVGGLLGGTVYTLTPYDQRNPYARHRGGGGGNR